MHILLLFSSSYYLHQKTNSIFNNAILLQKFCGLRNIHYLCKQLIIFFNYGLYKNTKTVNLPRP